MLACPLLINTITSMVLISIHPFAFRKILLAIIAFLCFSALCFADPVLMVRRYSPHSERLDPARVTVSSSQDRQDIVVKRAETDPLQSFRFSYRQTKSQFTNKEGASLPRSAPLAIVENAATCAQRSGWQDEMAGWPLLPPPGEI